MMMMLFTREFWFGGKSGFLSLARTDDVERERVRDETEQPDEAIEKSKSTRSFARNGYA